MRLLAEVVFGTSSFFMGLILAGFITWVVHGLTGFQLSVEYGAGMFFAFFYQSLRRGLTSETAP